jgi:hypothetical protein
MGHGARIKEQVFRLILHRPDDVRMAVPGSRNGVASVGIEPLVSLLVDEPGAPSADRADGELGVDGEEGGRTVRRTAGQAVGCISGLGV